MSGGKRGRRRRWIVRALLAVLALAVLGGGAVAWTVGTEGGARWAVGLLDRHGLEVGEVRGRLLGPLHLRDVAYRTPRLQVLADALEVEWRPGALRRRTLEVRSVRLEALAVVLTETDEDPPGPEAPGELPVLSLPVHADLRELHVAGLRIGTEEGNLLELESLRASGEVRGSAMILEGLEARSKTLLFQALGRVETRDAYPVALEFTWRGAFPELPEMEGRGSLEGTLSRMLLRHRLTAPGSSDLEAEIAGLPGPPEWRASFGIEPLELSPFLPAAPLDWASLEGEASGVGAEARARLEFAGGGGELDRVSGSVDGEAREGTVHLHRFRAAGGLGRGTVTADGSGSFRRGDEGLGEGEVSIRWSAAIPDRPELGGRIRAAGTAELLEVEHLLEAPVPAELRVSVTDVTEELRWTADLTAPPFALDRLDSELPALRAALAASGSGDRSAFSGSGSLGAWTGGEEGGDPVAEADLRFEGDLDERWAVLEELVLRPGTGGLLRARGRVELGPDAPRFQLAGDWTGLAWPADEGRPALRSGRGRFSVGGTPGAYGTETEGTLEVEDLPVMTLSQRGRGGRTGYELDSLDVRGEGLRIGARGRIAWDPALAWEASMEIEEALLDALGAPVPGRVESRLSGDGSLGEEGMTAALRVERLSYEDGERRVEARAGGRAAGRELHLDHLQVSSGVNLLRARGSVDEEWSMEWEVDAPDLAVGLDMAGELSGEGGISGPRARPRIRGELEGGRIRAGDLTLDTARVSLSLDLSDRDPSRVRFFLAGADRDGVGLEARIAGDGRLGEHLLEVAARRETGHSVSVEAAGTLDLPPARAANGDPSPESAASPPGWEGEVTGLVLGLGGMGEWVLASPAGVRAGADSAHVERFCLVAGRAESCLEGGWSRERGGEARFEIRGFDLDRTAELLPPRLRVSGTGFLRAEAAVDEKGRLSGRVGAHLEESRLRYVAAVDVEETRDLAVARMGAELDPEGVLRGDLALRLVDGDGVEGEWTMGPVPSGPETSLSGRLSAELRDRGLLGALSDELSDTDGTLEANLLVGGTLGAPRLTGEVRLEEGTVDVPGLGIRVEEIHLAARDRNEDRWGFEGGARSGRGSLRVDGSVLLPRPDRPAAVTAELEGEGFQAMNNALARADISPALQLLAERERVEVAGSVAVPRARITPGDMEDVVSRSPDVVMAGSEPEEEGGEVIVPELPVANLHGRVRVVMGDSVFVDGYGVTGRITGSVTVVEEPDRLLTGQGELRLVDGTYTAARQRLTIERGRLIWADRPVEDPGLDVRVVRRTREVLAGMEIRGTAREPEVTIFSDPAMPESEAMAYLFIGRPIRGTGREDGALMERVATSMGFAGGAALLDRMAPVLGLAEARIERGERLSDAALVVGTHFTPRLFVSYGVGLFGDVGSALRLRYQLAEHWILRTESGRELGADLLYSVER